MVTETAKATLLLVEDEASLVGLLQRYLDRLGFAVSTAESGEAALAHVQASPPQIVVLDLGLPDLPGAEVLERILSSSPSTRVLVSSGTPFSAEAVPEGDRSRVGFLQKPYMPQALLHSVQELLAGGTPFDSGE